MLMSAEAYRESLRARKPTVFVDGERIGSVADAPQLAPGVAAVARTYDMALAADLAPVMRAPLPGLSPGISDLVIEAAALGIDHTELVNRILNAALKRYAMI